MMPDRLQQPRPIDAVEIGLYVDIEHPVGSHCVWFDCEINAADPGTDWTDPPLWTVRQLREPGGRGLLKNFGSTPCTPGGLYSKSQPHGSNRCSTENVELGLSRIINVYL